MPGSVTASIWLHVVDMQGKIWQDNLVTETFSVTGEGAVILSLTSFRYTAYKHELHRLPREWKEPSSLSWFPHSKGFDSWECQRSKRLSSFDYLSD